VICRSRQTPVGEWRNDPTDPTDPLTPPDPGPGAAGDVFELNPESPLEVRGQACERVSGRHRIEANR